MISWFRLLAGVAALFAATLPVSAQVQTGSILIRTMDEQQSMLPGVTVTISSPTLVARQMTGVTDAGGVYRFPSLPPGVYRVQLELAGFQTLLRENIIVGVGQTTPVDLTLRVATLEETITVTDASPTVDTTSANVHVTLSQDLLQKTPGGRDIWSLVEYKVPGLISSRPDVGGSAGGLQGGMTARGTPNSQNAQFLNGINVGDPAAIGFAGFYYDYDAFEEIQVSTGAHDISVPGSGVFLNMSTRSGGNRWSGKASFYWKGDATQGSNVDSDLLSFGFRPETNSVDFVSDVSVIGGGPIHDKVRFFGAFRDWRVHVNVPAASSTTVLDETNITSGLGNVTWQISDKNRFTGFYTRQYYKKPNRFLGSSAFFTDESNSNEDDVFDIVQGLWNSVLTNRLFMDARVSFNRIFFPLFFNGSDQTLNDLSTGIRTGNALTEQIFIRKRLQTSATFNYFLEHALGGRHELRFGFDHAHAPTSTDVRRWDDVALNYRSATNEAVNVTLFNTPVQSRATVDLTALFVQDTYTVQRLTLTGGLRWERLESYLPEQSSPPSRWFPDQQRSYPAIRDIVLWHTVGPRASATYDLLGDGKTALKFSAGRYYYLISTGTPNAVNPNFSVSAQHAWNDANGDLRFQDGEQVGEPILAGGLTTEFDPDFKRPYTNEVTAGVDRELLPNLRLSTTFTYRAERRPQASLNTAAPFDTWARVNRADPGPDGVTGTADDGIVNYFDRTVAGTRTLITNDPTQRQTYKGIEITATRRFADRWQVLGGYTYARTRVSDISVAPSPNDLINAEGQVFNDRPHQLKISGTYVLPYDIYVSGNFRVQSGAPVNRTVSVPLSLGGGNATINVEPPGTHRLDRWRTLDLRGARSFRFGNGRELELSLDGHNVTNTNTAWEVRTLTGRLNVRRGGDPAGELINHQQFLSPTQVFGPRDFRFGAAFRW